jgi:hypothetical protein
MPIATGHNDSLSTVSVHGDGRAGERQSYSAPSLSSAVAYDIAVDRVSLVGNYRARFDRVMRKSGYAELVRLPPVTENGLCVAYALTTAGGAERPLDSVLSQGARRILVRGARRAAQPRR